MLPMTPVAGCYCTCLGGPLKGGVILPEIKSLSFPLGTDDAWLLFIINLIGLI